MQVGGDWKRVNKQTKEPVQGEKSWINTVIFCIKTKKIPRNINRQVFGLEKLANEKFENSEMNNINPITYGSPNRSPSKEVNVKKMAFTGVLS